MPSNSAPPAQRLTAGLWRAKRHSSNAAARAPPSQAARDWISTSRAEKAASNTSSGSCRRVGAERGASSSQSAKASPVAMKLPSTFGC